MAMSQRTQEMKIKLSEEDKHAEEIKQLLVEIAPAFSVYGRHIIWTIYNKLRLRYHPKAAAPNDRDDIIKIFLCIGHPSCPTPEEFAALIYILEKWGLKYEVIKVAKNVAAEKEWETANQKTLDALARKNEEEKQEAEVQGVEWHDWRTPITIEKWRAKPELNHSALGNALYSILRGEKTFSKYKAECEANNTWAKITAHLEGEYRFWKKIKGPFEITDAHLEETFNHIKDEIDQAIRATATRYNQKHPEEPLKDCLKYIKAEEVDFLAMMTDAERPLGAKGTKRQMTTLWYKGEDTEASLAIEKYGWLFGKDGKTVRVETLEFEKEARLIQKGIFAPPKAETREEAQVQASAPSLEPSLAPRPSPRKLLRGELVQKSSPIDIPQTAKKSPPGTPPRNSPPTDVAVRLCEFALGQAVKEAGSMAKVGQRDEATFLLSTVFEHIPQLLQKASQSSGSSGPDESEEFENERTNPAGGSTLWLTKELEKEPKLSDEQTIARSTGSRRHPQSLSSPVPVSGARRLAEPLPKGSPSSVLFKRSRSASDLHGGLSHSDPGPMPRTSVPLNSGPRLIRVGGGDEQ